MARSCVNFWSNSDGLSRSEAQKFLRKETLAGVLSFLKSISLCSLLIAWTIPSSYAQTVAISPEVGKVEEIRQGWNGKTLIMIQEAHADYGAQKAIVQILESLIAQKSLRLILVEGGWDNVGLSYLRSFGDAARRKQVAEEYLQSGKIHAEEYLDIISEYPLFIWGVEDPKLYESNMQAFLELEPERAKLIEQVKAALEKMNQKSPAMLGQELAAFEKMRQDFSLHQTSLTVYLQYLFKTGRLKTSQYPSLKPFEMLLGASSDFDAQKAELEKSELIRVLTRTTSKLEMDEIHLLMEKKTPEAELELIRSLLKLLEKNKVLAPKYPAHQLRSYLILLQEMQSSKMQQIQQDLDALTNTIETESKLASEAVSFLRALHVMEQLHRLFSLQMTPQDLEKFKMSQKEFSSSNFIASLQTWTEQDMTTIFSWIPKSMAFYDSAIQREQALVQNTLERFKTEPDSVAAMITGGFHGEQMMNEFHLKGYTVVNITPRFQVEDSGALQQRYLKLLKEKWDSRIQS